jgi:hypothetical protein
MKNYQRGIHVTERRNKRSPPENGRPFEVELPPLIPVIGRRHLSKLRESLISYARLAAKADELVYVGTIAKAGAIHPPFRTRHSGTPRKQDHPAVSIPLPIAEDITPVHLLNSYYDVLFDWMTNMDNPSTPLRRSQRLACVASN